MRTCFALLVVLALAVFVLGELTPEKKAEFDEYFKPNGVICDICNSSEHVIPVVRGKPTEDLMMYAKETGNVKIGGCTFSAQGYCKSCDPLHR